MPTTFRLGSRKSELALWQTNYVKDLLLQSWPGLEVEVITFVTEGDRILEKPLPLIGGKGVFTTELEAKIDEGTIDAAIHSLKDLPVESPQGLALGSVPERENPADVLVSRGSFELTTLPSAATVGTSSRRRAAQILYSRPDLKVLDIRGNVPTRIRKAMDLEGAYDAIVLAYAGLARLDRLDVVSQVLSFDQMMPAPGQGALGVQCRDEKQSLTLLSSLNHRSSSAAVTAERSFLQGLGGGCAMPIAAYGEVSGNHLSLVGRVIAEDGSTKIDVKGSSSIETAQDLGRRLAQEALDEGARAILENVRG
jgi:hydroxymethylbilane synthase